MRDYEALTRIRDEYWKELDQITPQPVNENMGPIPDDLKLFATYLSQLIYRSQSPDQRPFIPEIRARLYNPNNTPQYTRPCVLVIGKGGISRAAGPERDDLLTGIIGWTREQVLSNIGQPLNIRLVHLSSVPDSDRVFQSASWENILKFLIEYYKDLEFGLDLQSVAHELSTLTYDQIVTSGGKVATVREELRKRIGLSHLFTGNGRMSQCNEFFVDPKIFFGSPGMEIQIP